MSVHGELAESAEQVGGGGAALSGRQLPSLGAVEIVPVRLLRRGSSPRSEGEDADHAQALARSEAVLPPIVVHRPSMRVIDGMHRWQAAIARGEEVVRVRFFDGREQDAFLIAVRQNVTHGLPLSLGDRMAAAARIVESHGQWSDRAIAEVAGLSPRTVGEIRRGAAGESMPVAARMGRDGRLRPVNTAEGRILAARLMEKTPDASLRQIAQLARISPGTVRDVRARVSRGEHPVPESMRRSSEGDVRERPAAGGVSPEAEPAVRFAAETLCSPAAPSAGLTPSPMSAPVSAPTSVPEPAVAGPKRHLRSVARQDDLLGSLLKDPSLRYTEEGRSLLRLFSMTTLPGRKWAQMAEAVPGYSVSPASRLARGYAAAWLRFADELERAAQEPSEAGVSC